MTTTQTTTRQRNEKLFASICSRLDNIAKNNQYSLEEEATLYFAHRNAFDALKGGLSVEKLLIEVKEKLESENRSIQVGARGFLEAVDSYKEYIES